jgi:FdhE protein
MNPDLTCSIQAAPRSREGLAFLQDILDFQANLAERIEPDLQIERDVALAKWLAGEPLFSGGLPSPPSPSLREALTGLRPLLPAGGTAQVTLDQLLASQAMEQLLGSALIGDSQTLVRRVAEVTLTEPEVVDFLFGAVLAPFYQRQAAPYRAWLAEAAWRRGCCPICGCSPRIARLAAETGQRILVCSLCSTDWAFDRLRCPFCESDELPCLRHFAVDGDEAHRVDCCDRCRGYLKTVDERVTGHAANVPVEDLLTAHLDMLAQELGYR